MFQLTQTRAHIKSHHSRRSADLDNRTVQAATAPETRFIATLITQQPHRASNAISQSRNDRAHEHGYQRIGKAKESTPGSRWQTG